jgi:hypothetical protein
MTVQIASGMAGRQLTGTSSCSQSSEDSSVPDGSIRAQDGRLLVRLMVVHRVASDLFFVGHLDLFSGSHTGYCIILRSVFFAFSVSMDSFLACFCVAILCLAHYTEEDHYLSIRGQHTLSG